VTTLRRAACVFLAPGPGTGQETVPPHGVRQATLRRLLASLLSVLHARGNCKRQDHGKRQALVPEIITARTGEFSEPSEQARRSMCRPSQQTETSTLPALAATKK